MCHNALMDQKVVRIYLWYFYNQWIMFRLKALDNVDANMDKIYVMTPEYCWPWKIDVKEDMVELEADIVKIDSSYGDVIPLSKDGDNAFCFKETYERMNNVLKQKYNSEYKKYPDYFN